MQQPGKPILKSPPTGGPRKRSVGTRGILILLGLIVVGALTIGGIALFAPVRLAVVHELMLGMLHGGVVDSSEKTYVDGCVITREGDTEITKAITRTHRTVTFGDGSTLEVIFSGVPTQTNVCPQ
jgi:hypothetical protein